MLSVCPPKINSNLLIQPQLIAKKVVMIKGDIQQLRGPNFTQFWPHPPRMDKNGHLFFVMWPSRGLFTDPSSCPRSYWMPPKDTSHQLQHLQQIVVCSTWIALVVCSDSKFRNPNRWFLWRKKCFFQFMKMSCCHGN